jgi:hypothetical protein
MTLTAQQKGKGRLVPQESAKCTGFSRSPSPSTSSSPSSSHSSSESESDEDSSEDEEEEEDEEDDVSQEYLDSLLEKARRSIASKAIGKTAADKGDVLEEDIIGLDDPESELKCVPPPPFHFSLYLSPLARFSSYSRSLPPLDPGTLPNSYITLGKTLNDAPLAVRDLDAERVIESSLSLSAPAPPPPPPELTKSGKPLTKKEKKAVGRSQVILSMHCRTNALVS